MYEFLLSVVAAAGGAAVLALAVFRAFGQSWLESKFKESLERFRHEQAKELQQLKVKIESLLSGALKMQEREFDVLPIAWQKLHQAYVMTEFVASPLQQHFNVLGASEDEVEEYFLKSNFLESEKNRLRNLRNSSDPGRDREASNIIFARRCVGARIAVAELYDYIASQGIFLPDPLREMFIEVHKLLESCVLDIESEELPRRIRTGRALLDPVAKLHSQIEDGIRRRLQSHGSGAVSHGYPE